MISEVFNHRKELNTWGDRDEREKDQNEIHSENNHKGEEGSLAGEIALSVEDHLDREANMEGPGKSESGIKNPGLRIEGEIEVDRDPEHCPDEGVERNKIGGKCDKPIEDIGFNMSPFAGHFEVKNRSAGEINGPSMGEFMSENVDP